MKKDWRYRLFGDPRLTQSEKREVFRGQMDEHPVWTLAFLVLVSTFAGVIVSLMDDGSHQRTWGAIGIGIIVGVSAWVIRRATGDEKPVSDPPENRI